MYKTTIRQSMVVHGQICVTVPSFMHNLPPKRCKRKVCQFEMLFGEWNANDGNHEKDACCNIFNGGKKASENEPDYISDYSYVDLILIKNSINPVIDKLLYLISVLPGEYLCQMSYL
jgi:hypothetical protein